MNTRALAAAFITLLLAAPLSRAAFHLVEIEQMIGGLNGEASAQAIQLQLRNANNNVLAGTRLVAYDAAGLNPIVLFDFTANGPSSVNQSRILLTSANFNLAMSGILSTDGLTAFGSDYTLTNVIPNSYRAGGKVVFQNDAGTSRYWSIAFGSYTGTNTGTTDNDNDGDFGTPFALALPTDARGLLYRTFADVPSGSNRHTINSTEFALTAGNATVIRADGKQWVVVPEPGTVGMLVCGGLALSGLVWSRRRRA